MQSSILDLGSIAFYFLHPSCVHEEQKSDVAGAVGAVCEGQPEGSRGDHGYSEGRLE